MEKTTFHSVLYPDAAEHGGEPDQPSFFTDLNLDQIISSITADRETYDLAPFFHEPLRDMDSIAYRHGVMRDLQTHSIFTCITKFAEAMVRVRQALDLMETRHYGLQKQAWFISAAQIYVGAVQHLAVGLADGEVASRGLKDLLAFLDDYVHSTAFGELADEIVTVRDDLGKIRYCTHIYGSKVTVSRYDSEADYGEEVLATFDKFKESEAKDYLAHWSSTRVDMDHVEANILQFVAKLHPGEFAELDTFCSNHSGFLDPTVARFDREIEFYVAYLEFIRPMEEAGLVFNYPTVSTGSKSELAVDTFDASLADKLVRDHVDVVCNSFRLEGAERIFVVSGPNQGGKSTFARTFGQLHFLATLGCPVPGTQSQLFLPDAIFTHFERQEDVQSLHGKLEDELIRVHQILRQATSQSVIVMNEIFTSTTLEDALTLGTKIMDRLTELDVLCVYVTFVDELASLNASTVSLVSEVNDDDMAERTFKVNRHRADGLAHAAVLADAYGLSYARLAERIAS